ncbi:MULTISPECIES: NPP1 family protein [unclassified Pseudoalteromonas]|uniref:NPP1 family protein n=1 Tax=unclassified Pseudoalteromonas TaxID=194690 RepID=UPI003014BC50
MKSKLACLAVTVLSSNTVLAEDFIPLDQALPPSYVINGTEPVFDFDKDGCLPAGAISRTGKQNSGEPIGGSITRDCRYESLLARSNTYHRYACHENDQGQFCGHLYELYFEKDQALHFFGGGHRHDVETVAIWTHDGIVTHGSVSAHGTLETKPRSQLPMENGHLKVVYHKDGILTHAFRFAKPGEAAENTYNRFVTPTIVSWYEMTGDGISNQGMRDRLNQFSYGSASFKIRDGVFIRQLNNAKPASYPTFTQQDALNSQ